MICAVCIRAELLERIRTEVAPEVFITPPTMPVGLEGCPAITIYNGDALCWEHGAQQIIPTGMIIRADNDIGGPHDDLSNW